MSTVMSIIGQIRNRLGFDKDIERYCDLYDSGKNFVMSSLQKLS